VGQGRCNRLAERGLPLTRQSTSAACSPVPSGPAETGEMDQFLSGANSLAHDLRDQITETMRRDTPYDPVIPEHPDGFVLHRYEEAGLTARRDAAYANYQRAVAARPIDDAAWDDELTRRARIDASLARFS
jgi:hypothetical protein